MYALYRKQQGARAAEPVRLMHRTWSIESRYKERSHRKSGTGETTD